MMLRHLFALLFISCVMASALQAQMLPVGHTVKSANPSVEPIDQPYINAWWPETILSWTPGADPDAPYNRSNVALRQRFLNPETQINDHARADEATINSLAAFHSTSFNPSQGSLDADFYAFGYWQYVDRLVFWGGSASEGIILPPNPTITDAAHRNGVKVLGNVFFPPGAFGGDIQWVWDLLQKDGDSFPVADKMIEVAEYYGFDGWFLNQETAGGNSQLARDMRDFMIYMQENSDLEIEWYDAMTESGVVAWQNQLNSVNDWFLQFADTLVSEKMFLNFQWNSTLISNSRTHANSLGRSEYDLYAGIDVQANGYNTNVSWTAVFPEGQPHVTSMGIHRPDWSFASAVDNTDFYARESRFWVGENGDPANTGGTALWKGFAHYVPAFSTITELPFTTNFNTGHGSDFYVNGQKVSHLDLAENGWNNLSVQDILPTWRWTVQSDGSKLVPEFDWADAYYGGNSLRISGILDSPNQIELFKTRLDIDLNTALDIAYKKSGPAPIVMSIALAFEDEPTNYTYLEVADNASEEWQLQTLDLSPFAGSTIAIVSIFLAVGNPEYQINIGRLSIYETTGNPPAAASNLILDNRVDEGDIITLRLRWEHSTDGIYYYNVFRENPDLSVTYLGSTPNNAYFVPQLKRVSGDSSISVQVVAVGEDFQHSEPITIDIPALIPPGVASNPSPADGAMDVFRNASLSWTAGLGHSYHEVYFGVSDPPPLIAEQTESTYQPGDMKAQNEYYWQVNEVNDAGITEGPLWSFTTGSEFIDTTGAALEFDGSNDYVNMGNAKSLQLTGNEITMEANVFVNAFKPQVWAGSIIVKDQTGGAGLDHGYMLRCGGNGQLNINLGDGSWHELNSPAAVVPLQQWVHISGTYDGQKLRLYVDGVEVAQSAGLNVNIGLTDEKNLYIGESPGFPGRVFDGKIDEVRLWEVARSQSQLQSTMDGLLGEQYYSSADSGLTGYWRFDEGDGQTAFDLSINGNSGTLGSTTGEDTNDPAWTEGDVPAGIDEEAVQRLPTKFVLRQNFPNPFNPATTINYQLPSAGSISLVIYNVLGEQVRQLEAVNRQPAGYFSRRWDGTNDSGLPVASGIYLYRLEAGSFVQVRKMVLIR